MIDLYCGIMIDAVIHKNLRNIPIGGAELVAELGRINLNRPYSSPAAKLSELERNGDIIRLKKGLYVVDSSDFGFPPSAPICSNHIYGPSYLSMQWVLSYYGLIPERVHLLTAVSIKHSRKFENKLGTFTYYTVNRSYFPIGLTTEVFDGASCLIATQEKALADFIQSDMYVPSQSVVALTRYLEEDIRFDMDALRHFDTHILATCAEQGRKKNVLNNLIKIINKL